MVPSTTEEAAQRSRPLGLRLASWSFIGGGPLLGVAALLFPEVGSGIAVRVLPAVAAVAAAAALARWGQRIPLPWLHALPVAGTLLVTVAIATSSDPTFQRVVVCLYLLNACITFFVARWQAVLHLALMLSCCAATMLIRPGALYVTSGLITAGATVALASVIYALRRSVLREPRRWPAPGQGGTAGARRDQRRPDSAAAVLGELADAVESGRFEVVYQPIVRLDAPHSAVAVEALFRWHSALAPHLGTEVIIGLVEDADLITELDHCVLDRALRDAHQLQEAAQAPLSMHVYVCGLDLLTKDYLQEVEATLRGNRWPAEQLILEITERAAVTDTATAIAVLQRLRSRGIGIAIDDFGAGYSSLGRINDLPVDMIKLDASFITGMVSEPLLRAIVALGASIDLPLVAEGIETPHQAALLTHCGFTLGQGYLFGRPQPLPYATEWFRSAATKPPTATTN